MRVSDQIIDIARGAGYGGLNAIEIAAQAIRDFNESRRDAMTFTLGSGRAAVSFTLTRKGAA